MLNRVLADIVVFTHFAFIVFALFGGLLALRWRWMPWVHLPAAAWSAVVEFSGWICPLTPLENTLRRASGESGYSGGFIDRYLMPVIYPEGLTRDWQLVIGAVLVALNSAVYFVVWRRRRRRSSHR